MNKIAALVGTHEHMLIIVTGWNTIRGYGFLIPLFTYFLPCMMICISSFQPLVYPWMWLLGFWIGKCVCMGKEGLKEKAMLVGEEFIVSSLLPRFSSALTCDLRNLR